MVKKENSMTEIVRRAPVVLLLFVMIVSVFSLGCISSKERAEEGDTLLVYYTLTLEDGTLLESNVGSQPMTVVLGQTSLISGFENALHGMTVNQTKKVTLQPEEAYGFYNPNNIRAFDRTEVVDVLGFVPKVGDFIPGVGSIIEVTEDAVVFDRNHELVDTVLVFEITVAEIQKK